MCLWISPYHTSLPPPPTPRPCLGFSDHTPQMPPLRDIDDLLVATQSQVRSYIAALGVASADVDDIAQEFYLAHARPQP